MKKASSMLIYSLFALTVLYPAGFLITACFGYSFELISISAFAAVIAFLSACTVVLDLIFRATVKNQALLSVITPLSLLNAVLYIFMCPQILVIASVWFSAGCCCFLTLKHGFPGKPLAITVVSLVLSALMVLPIGFFSYIAFLMGDFGQNTVVKTLDSPSGEYYAQVIDSDQGALGGDTLVDVFQRRGINLLLFKIEKRAQRVYWGEWGAYKHMDIYWKDDHCLVINSVEYEIE